MKVFEPYNHDCPHCKWVGWGHDGNHNTNIYLCEPPNRTRYLIIRYSSKDGDYRSLCIDGAIKGSLADSTVSE